MVNAMETEQEQETKYIGSYFDEYKETESKFYQNIVQAIVLETIQKRIRREEGYMTYRHTD